MMFRKLLIANRGEITIHIARVAAMMGLLSVVIYSEDDRDALHPLRADEAVPLSGTGPRAYLDSATILAAARAVGAEAIHPGYGLLSENTAFARQCTQVSVQFIGPSPRVLDLFGSKAHTRAPTHRAGIPVVSGTQGITTLEETRAFFAVLPPPHGMMIKAVFGGDGRGMRAVHDARAIAGAYVRCVSEATAAGDGSSVYMEALVPAPCHIEIQIAIDTHGHVTHPGERECSLQCRHQKLIKIAPSPTLGNALRARIAKAAVTLTGAAGYNGVGTFEFLVGGADTPHATFYSMEANPRVQVGHTITEMVTGINLVVIQPTLTQGTSLADVELAQPIAPHGHAVQVRISTGTLDASGQPHPSTGVLTAFKPPNDPGVRVDTYDYAGYHPSPHFDSLLARLIVHTPHGMYAQTLTQTYHALCKFRIEGVVTNRRLLQSLLRDADVQTNAVHTQFLDAKLADLAADNGEAHPTLHATSAITPDLTPATSFINELPDDAEVLTTPMGGALVQIHTQVSATIARGEALTVIETMKMEHVVIAPAADRVLQVCTQPGTTAREGQPLAALQPGDVQHDAAATDAEVDLSRIHPGLQAVIDRHAFDLDANHPDAVARHRKTDQRTARENIVYLYDSDSFIEYDILAATAQRQWRALDDLIRSTPVDGIITGIGTVSGTHFSDHDAHRMVLMYDCTVLANTQGTFNHKRTDRALELAQQQKLSAVLFAEGGDGRPDDTEKRGASGLDYLTFIHFARLSGLVPTVGIVSGRCLVGNTVLLGCADMIIAARDMTTGMGDPAMIGDGGLGVYTPGEVGPINVQMPNGVINTLVGNETEAMDTAHRYLSYFQGPFADWEAGDVRHLHHVIPEGRIRGYDMRAVIDASTDTDLVLELRQAFGVGIITTLIRIGGRAFGYVANNPRHLDGATNSAAADKASRFIQLRNAFNLPIVSLCSTPGFMVRPEAEKTVTVRHVSHVFVTAGNLRVLFFTIVLHKGYSLEAIAMAAGGFHAPLFTVSWPSGEFGGMDTEGAIRLGYHKELRAVKGPAEHEALFRKMVDAAYEEGHALNIASYLEIDTVIDPTDMRRWLLRGLQSAPSIPPRHTRDPATRRFIDTW